MLGSLCKGREVLIDQPFSKTIPHKRATIKILLTNWALSDLLRAVFAKQMAYRTGVDVNLG